MEVKRCGRCKAVKSIEEFAFRDEQKGWRNGYCKLCMKHYQANYYQANKQHHNKVSMLASRRWRRRKKEELQAAVQAMKCAPCTDCNKRYPPYVMHFDHLDGSTKIDNIAAMVHNVRPLDAILQEISKCELVCSNCHAERTYRRRKKTHPYAQG